MKWFWYSCVETTWAETHWYCMNAVEWMLLSECYEGNNALLFSTCVSPCTSKYVDDVGL